MSFELLPTSAAAGAPRPTSVIVLLQDMEPWITAVLERINVTQSILQSVVLQQRYLSNKLASPNAIWTLASIMLPKVTCSDTVIEVDKNQIIHIEAYIVHVDLVHRNELSFKLTTKSIEYLVQYHERMSNTNVSTEESSQVKKMHEEFIRAINDFVYWTHAKELEGLDEDGAGELLCEKSEKVKHRILNLFRPAMDMTPLSTLTTLPFLHESYVSFIIPCKQYC